MPGPMGPPERTDRKLRTVELNKLQRLVGDAHLVPNTGTDAQANPALGTACAAGHCLLLCPWAEQAAACVQRYRECKAASPHSTSACIVLPKSAEVSHLTVGMRCVKEFPAGSTLYASAEGRALSPTAGTTQVWYDPPVPHPEPRLSSTSSSSLTHVYPGTLAGAPVSVLADTGATHVFVAESFVKRIGLHVSPTTHARVTLADGASSVIVGECSAKLALGRFTASVTPLVLTNMSPGVDLILGDAFFKQYMGRVEYTDPPALVLRKGLASFRVATRKRSASEGAAGPNAITHRVVALMAQRVTPEPMTGRQAKRAVRHGAPSLMVWVKNDSAATATASEAARASSNAETANTDPPGTATPDDLMPEAKLQAILSKERKKGYASR